MENFAFMVPGSSLNPFRGIYINVPFFYKERWDEFKVWVDEGNLRQLNLDSTPVDVWIRSNTDLVGDSPASLQEHFDAFRSSPTGYKYHGYEVKL